MNIVNIAAYKFINISQLEELRTAFLAEATALNLKGTILLSSEGINLTLAGLQADIIAFKNYLAKDARFQDLSFRESLSVIKPFKRMLVKIKKEIITMREPAILPEAQRAPAISARDFKQWLDEGRDVTILDTRNTFEVEVGAFVKAQHFNLKDFSSFPKALENAKLDKEKAIVTYCTGGIRCEKAALYLMSQGYEKVYQLDGGMLQYFSECGGEHYQGDCFVFDERIALDGNLKPRCQVSSPINSVGLMGDDT